VKTILPITVMLLAGSLLAWADPTQTPPGPALSPDAALSRQWEQDSFEADVYPSARAAAKRLGLKWAQELSLSLSEPPEAIRIVAQPSVPPAACQEIRASVQFVFPQTQCVLDEPANPSRTPSTRPSELRVALKMDTPRNRTAPADAPTSGSLTLTLATAPNTVASVSFVDKPWADSFAEFANQRPNQRWLVARPKGPCPTVAAADEEARGSATAAILDIVRARLLQIPGLWSDSNARWVANKIQAQLARGGLITDRFLQRFDRPYGAFYRQAVLVDISQQNIDRLTRECVWGLQEQRETWARTAGSVVILLVVIYALYLFLNAYTKGYFTWRLRTTSLALALLGILAVLFFTTCIRMAHQPGPNTVSDPASQSPSHTDAPATVIER